MEKQSAGSANDEGKKYEQMAYTSLQKKDFKEAETNFLTALQHMEDSGDETGQAYTLGNLGNIYFQRRRWDEARDYYQKSLALMEKLKDEQGIESSLGNLGNVSFYQGELDAAQENYVKALKLVEQSQNLKGLIQYNENLGNIALQKRDFQAAEQYFETVKAHLVSQKEDAESIPVVEEKIKALKKQPEYLEAKEKDAQSVIDQLTESKQHSEIIKKYQELEEMYYEAKRFDKVIEINRKIIGVLEEMNDAPSIAICHANLGSTLLHEGLSGKPELLEQAEANFKQALEFVEKQNDQRRQAYLLGNLGILYLHKNDFDQSYDYYNRSLKIMTEMGDELGEARSYANLGKIESLKKNWDAAAEQYGRSLQIMEKLQNRPGMAQQNEALGEVFLQKENFEEAEKFLQNANAMYEALKDPQGIRIVQDKLLYLISHPKSIQKRKEEIEAELKTPEVENDNAKKIALLTDLGNTFFLGSQLDDARNTLERVLKIQEETGDKSGMSSTYGNLGSILSEKEDWEASDQCYEKAIELREELSSDSTALLELYSNRAIVLIHLNKLDKAEKLMKQSLKINEKTGSGKGLLGDYRNLGNLSLQKRDWAGAEQFYKKALDLNTKLNIRREMAEDYRNLFNLYVHNENWNEAEKYGEKALAIAEELQDLRSACQDIRSLAKIYNEKKDRSKVEPYYKMALERSQQLDDPREIAIDLRNLGALYLEKGYTEKAEEFYKKALGISEELGDPKEMAEDYRNMGNYHFRRGHSEYAEEYYKKALDYTLKVDDAFGSAKDYTFLGNLKFRGQNFDEAEEYFKKASDIFNEKKNFVNLVQLHMTVARMNLAESRKDPCKAYLDQAEEVAQLLGNPEKLTSSIEEMRKMVDKIDKI